MACRGCSRFDVGGRVDKAVSSPGRFTCEVVASEVFRSEIGTGNVVVTGKIFGSEVTTGNLVVGAVGCVGAVVAGEVGFFFGDVGSLGSGWWLAGEIGGAEVLAARAVLGLLPLEAVLLGAQQLRKQRPVVHERWRRSMVLARPWSLANAST